MECFLTSKLDYKRTYNNNHELGNTHLAAIIQSYCQQCKRILNITDTSSHLQSDEQKKTTQCGIVRHVERIILLLLDLSIIKLSPTF